MEKAVSIKGRWERLYQGMPRVKTWVLWATLLGTAVFLYWTYLGASYASTARDAASLEQKMASLAPAPTQASLGLAVDAEKRLQEITMVFKRNDSENTVQMVYEVAKASGAEVTALIMGKASAKIENGVRYDLQPITLNLNGSNDKVVRFLDELHQQIPALVVVDARLSGSEGGPTAQMQLVLYFSPQTAPTGPATKK